jgi:hypothetical protein
VWIAEQVAKAIQEAGAATFVHEMDSADDSNFQPRLKDEIKACDELLVLFTRLSSNRAWVWTEIGAAWILGKPISIVFYDRAVSDFVNSPQGRAILDERRCYQLNDLSLYLEVLGKRLEGIQDV